MFQFKGLLHMINMYIHVHLKEVVEPSQCVLHAVSNIFGTNTAQQTTKLYTLLTQPPPTTVDGSFDCFTCSTPLPVNYNTGRLRKALGWVMEVVT